jgi:hypothetical protein
VTPLWQLIVSGAVGSALTYGLTWWREHRRLQDAYRAPQRQAIGEILAAGHVLQLRVLNWCRALADLIEEVRQGRDDNMAAISAVICETESAYAAALFEMRRAIEVGSLTVVDVRCWQEMVVVAAAFSRFDEGPNLEVADADAAEQFVARLQEGAAELRAAARALVRTANDRVTPAESRCNRGQRRNAQRQLAAYLRDELDEPLAPAP